MKINYLNRFTLLLLISLLISSKLFSAEIIWTNKNASNSSKIASFTSQHRSLILNVNALKELLKAAPLENFEQNVSAKTSKLILDIPAPDGSINLFSIVEAPVMQAGLAAKYPEIKTYLGQGITNPNSSVRLDFTPAGFHAMVYDFGGTYLIEPEIAGDISNYISFYKKNITIKKDFHCSADAKMIDEAENSVEKSSSSIPSGSQLRTYSLALACTGEYAATKGGTVAGTLAGMVTSVNRVNGIYETEVAIRMVLINNTDLLIYLNGATDPYDNNNGSAMLSQNISTINTIIGAANYDFGHVFSTGGGGVAFLGSVCGGSKAGGVTGLPSPVGDAFDVDYVAHEIGHQFGGNHTFNSASGSCSGNRASNAAYEPGSGTTIMAYAGICGADDLQPNSDPYFHVKSFDEIIAFSTLGGGNGCATITATGNDAPVIPAFTTSFNIPRGTPFTLTGSATDPNGDPLTYGWEQYNLGAAGSPLSPIGNAPRFRAFSPTLSPSRTFPKESSLLSNTTAIGEVLSSAAQTLTFRFIARDNRTGGGGVDYETATVVVSANGPFLVNSPNTNVAWNGNTSYPVTWTVASTNLAPINATNVNILLSTDGGKTFPITLKSNVPNDGADSILLPLIRTTQARIKIEAVGNIFFDISNANFQIQSPDFDFATNAAVKSACVPDTTDYALNLSQFFGFNEPVTFTAVGLPLGISVDFNNPVVIPPASIIASVISTNLAATGNFSFYIKGTSASVVDSILLTINVSAGVPSQITTIFPANNAVNVNINPTLSFTASAGNATYTLEIATDSLFTNIVRTTSNLAITNYVVTPTLLNSTKYFWRVRGSNICGLGLNSDVQSFTTLIAAPAAPSALNGIVISSSRITISWTDNSLTELGFIIERSRATAGNYLVIDTVIAGTLIYEDSFLLANTRYFYRVKSYNVGGNSANSSSVNRTTLPNAPIAPSALIANALTPSTSKLDWTDNSNNETGFIVERSLNQFNSYVALDTVAASIKTFNDANLLENTIYYYRVTAINTGGNSASSNIASILTFGNSIAIPSSLNATALSSSSINLTWNDNSSNEEVFIIERALGLSQSFVIVDSVLSNSSSFTDINLLPLTLYNYKIRAFSSLIGNSNYSNADTASTKSTVGINSLSNENLILVYPNPSNNVFTLNLENKTSGNYTISVLDILGKNILQTNFTKTKNESLFFIDLSERANGIYVLTLIDENGKISRNKLIKK